MFLRILVVTGFVGAIIAFQGRPDLPNVVPISQLVTLTYLLTLIYAVVLKWIKNLILFCYLQIAIDVFLEGGLIYITGGIDSPFAILFNLSIISASIILSRRGGYVIASQAAIVFGILLDFEYYGLLDPIRIYPPSPMSESGGYVFNVIYLNFCAFFIIAFLSGFLAGKLHRTHEELIEKSGSLMALQAFHENVVRHMGDGLLTTDTEWKITSFNNAAERITGCPQEETVGRFLKDLFPFFEKKLSSHFFKTSHRPYRDEVIIKRKDSDNINIGTNLSPLFDKTDQIRGYIMVFQDLTYLKDMEKKLVRTERFAAIGQISASLAHEIRNPLASLSGSIQVLKGELKLSGSNIRLMDIVVEETDRLNQIISQFLDYANPKPPKFIDTEIEPIITDTVILLKNNKELNGNIEIEMRFNGDGIMCRVDPRQIKQILWNLCLNGIQAMPKGGCLKIVTGKWNSASPHMGSRSFFADDRRRSGDLPRKRSSPMLKIDIIDEGEGIDQEHKMKIFEPFFTTKERGTGLGLATVYRVIENHHGFIELESKPAIGTVFSIFLPLSQHFSS